MKRKLVKQGTSTMMVSLPSKWIKRNKLDKGSEIDIEEKDNSIIITSKITENKTKEIEINIDDTNRHDIRNILTHLYRNGFQKITIKNINERAIEEISESLAILLGFEIVDKSKEFLVIENISEPSNEKYDTIIRRIFLIIKETFININSPHEDIHKLREQHDKYILFCRRLLLKENSKDTILEWEILTALRHLEHKAYYMHKYLTEKNIKLDKETIRLIEDLEKAFNLLYETYFNEEEKNIYEISKIRNKKYFGECNKIMEKSSGKKCIIISYISECFRILGFASSPLLTKIVEKRINNSSTSVQRHVSN